ncbi:uncharacterized protein LOC108203381 [Daucus carota subsp. sativus]|uniref:uncharacterized protein LOC108203381 n=1 Tax=Daucus carota subsp. sativus TaxID=79200 RepID=UPI0030838209
MEAHTGLVLKIHKSSKDEYSRETVWKHSKRMSLKWSKMKRLRKAKERAFICALIASLRNTVKDKGKIQVEETESWSFANMQKPKVEKKSSETLTTKKKYYDFSNKGKSIHHKEGDGAAGDDSDERRSWQSSSMANSNNQEENTEAVVKENSRIKEANTFLSDINVGLRSSMYLSLRAENGVSRQPRMTLGCSKREEIIRKQLDKEQENYCQMEIRTRTEEVDTSEHIGKPQEEFVGTVDSGCSRHNGLVILTPVTKLWRKLALALTVGDDKAKITMGYGLIDMASNIPKFIKRSTKYEDLFGEASDSQAPLPVKPLSQLPSPSLEQKKTSSGGRKRDPSKTAEGGSSAEGRTSKKPRLALARSSPASSSSQKTQLFQRMLSDQIPEATVREWDRLSIAEATRDKVVANAKSLFLDLKMGEHVADTARVNEKMRADLKQAKADLASAVKDRDLVRVANQELKEAEAKVREERRKEDAVRRSLEEETDGLGKMVKRLEGQVKELQEAAAAAKAMRKEREAAVFEAGVAAGVKDCVKSAYRFFPDNDWAKLGPDAAVALEEAKVEDATSSGKAEASAKEVLGGTSEGETAAKDRQEAEKASLPELDVVAQVEALVVAPSQNAISSDALAIDEDPKASSSPADS